MFDYNKFRHAWCSNHFLNEIAAALDVPDTPTGHSRLRKYAQTHGLPPRLAWTRPYSVAEFTQAWCTSIHQGEVMERLYETSSNTYRRYAETLNLTRLPSRLPYDSEDLTQAWESGRTLDEVAALLRLPASKKTFQTLTDAAKHLGLEKKDREVPRTPDGYATNDIVAAWIDYYKNTYALSPTKAQIGMASREVKQLVEAGFTANTIKNALAEWQLDGCTGRLISARAQRIHARTSARAAAAEARQRAYLNEAIRPTLQIQEKQW